MLIEPLTSQKAKKLIREILEDGIITYSLHARERMEERKVSTVDCENILRGGVVDNAEWENGSWRHNVHTTKMWVVVRFESETILEIVTVGRNL